MPRGKVFKVDWQHDAASLKQAYQHEPLAALRPRLQALWFLREGKSLTEVAALVAVRYDTVQSWVRWYRQGGLAAVRDHLRGGRQGRQAKLTAEQQAQLVTASEKGEFYTAADIEQYLQTNFGVQYKAGGLYSLLRRNKIIKKRPRPQHLKADPQAQEQWKKGA